MKLCFLSKGNVTERFEGSAFRMVSCVGGQGIGTTASAGLAAIVIISQSPRHMALQKTPFCPAKRQNGQTGAHLAFMELS